jgi:hypothetical protein
LTTELEFILLFLGSRHGVVNALPNWNFPEYRTGFESTGKTCRAQRSDVQPVSQGQIVRYNDIYTNNTSKRIMPPYGEPDWATPGDTSKSNVATGLPPAMSLSGTTGVGGGTNVNTADVKYVFTTDN